MNLNPIKLIGGCLIGLLGFVIFMTTYFTVEQNERTVVTSWGEFRYVADPGLHFKMPFRDAITDYATDIQSYTPAKSINTFSADNQEVDVLFTIQYRVPPEAKTIEWLFNNNRNYVRNMENMVVDRIKVAMGAMNTQTLAQQRGQLRDRIYKMIAEDVRNEQRIEITDFQLTDMQFTKEYREAINKAAIQKADVERSEYGRQQAVKDAERAKAVALGEADRVRETAKGAADQQVIAAQAALKAAEDNAKATEINAKAQATATELRGKAEAVAIEVKGKAEAAAIKAQADALKANADLTELRKAEKWDGKLPVSIYGSAPIPFMQAR